MGKPGSFRRKASHPKQLQIDWSAAITAASSPLPAGDDATGATPPSMAAKIKAVRSITPRSIHRPTSAGKIIARLPVPPPLPAAVAGGHFGVDEEGKPIKPLPDEVRAITEALADRLVDALDGVGFASKKDDAAREASLPDGFHRAIAAYAEDFGAHAAGQLRAYVCRRALSDETDRAERGVHR